MPWNSQFERWDPDPEEFWFNGTVDPNSFMYQLYAHNPSGNVYGTNSFDVDPNVAQPWTPNLGIPLDQYINNQYGQNMYPAAAQPLPPSPITGLPQPPPVPAAEPVGPVTAPEWWEDPATNNLPMANLAPTRKNSTSIPPLTAEPAPSSALPTGSDALGALPDKDGGLVDWLKGALGTGVNAVQIIGLIGGIIGNIMSQMRAGELSAENLKQLQQYSGLLDQFAQNYPQLMAQSLKSGDLYNTLAAQYGEKFPDLLQTAVNSGNTYTAMQQQYGEMLPQFLQTAANSGNTYAAMQQQYGEMLPEFLRQRTSTGQAFEDTYNNVLSKVPGKYSDILDRYSSLTPKDTLAGIQALQQPLSRNLMNSIMRQIGGQLGERGLAQAPGIMTEELAQALAPYQIQLGEQAQRAYFDTMRLPLEVQVPGLQAPLDIPGVNIPSPVNIPGVSIPSSLGIPGADIPSQLQAPYLPGHPGYYNLPDIDISPIIQSLAGGGGSEPTPAAKPGPPGPPGAPPPTAPPPVAPPPPIIVPPPPDVPPPAEPPPGIKIEYPPNPNTGEPITIVPSVPDIERFPLSQIGHVPQNLVDLLNSGQTGIDTSFIPPGTTVSKTPNGLLFYDPGTGTYWDGTGTPLQGIGGNYEQALQAFGPAAIGLTGLGNWRYNPTTGAWDNGGVVYENGGFSWNGQALQWDQERHLFWGPNGSAYDPYKDMKSLSSAELQPYLLGKTLPHGAGGGPGSIPTGGIGDEGVTPIWRIDPETGRGGWQFPGSGGYHEP